MYHRYYDLQHEIVTCQHALDGFEVEFESKSKLYFKKIASSSLLKF